MPTNGTMKADRTPEERELDSEVDRRIAVGKRKFFSYALAGLAAAIVLTIFYLFAPRGSVPYLVALAVLIFHVVRIDILESRSKALEERLEALIDALQPLIDEYIGRQRLALMTPEERSAAAMHALRDVQKQIDTEREAVDLQKGTAPK